MQAVEKNGGDDGTRTRGLCRDRSEIASMMVRWHVHGSPKILGRFFSDYLGVVPRWLWQYFGC